MNSLMRTFPVWSLVILCTGGSWGLSGPKDVRGHLGGSLSLQCQYHKDYKTNEKYWCKGKIWDSCKIVIQTKSNSIMTKGRLSIRDNSTALTFTVTMESLTKADSGTYWCGIEKYFSDIGHPVIVTVLTGSSTSTSVTTIRELTGTGTSSAETRPTLTAPYSNIPTNRDASSENIFYILTSVILFLLLLFTLAMVILIRRWRRKKATEKEMSDDNQNNIFHDPPPSDTAVSALYSVPRKTASTGSDNLYCNVGTLPISGKPDSSYEEVQSQCMITPKGTDDVNYSNVRFSVNPNLEITTDTRPPPAKTSTEVTYAAIKTHYLSAAFDTIDHVLLLDRLKTIGVGGQVLEWFHSFLSDRSSTVTFKNTVSKPYTTSYGGSWGLHGLGEKLRVPALGSLSLQCQYEKDYKTQKKYWCKGEKRIFCITLIGTESNSSATKGSFSISDDSTALMFTVTMERLTEADSGKYWCGIEDPLLDPGVPVIVTVLPGSWGPRKVKGVVGGSLTLQCQNDKDDRIYNKYWCKGNHWSSCDILVDTTSKTNDRISLRTDQAALTFTVTMEQLSEADSGTYWCGTAVSFWNAGYPVMVTVHRDTSVIPPEISMTTLQKNINPGTPSEEAGSTFSIPCSTVYVKNTTHYQKTSSSVKIFYFVIPVIFLVCFVVVILIIKCRRKKGTVPEVSSSNENATSSALTSSDTVECPLYSVVRKPRAPSLDSSTASVSVSGKPQSCGEEIQSQCMITSRVGDDIPYSTLRFSVNPDLGNTTDTGLPQEKTPTEVTYSAIKPH
uniref:Uncharacterized protein LOC117366660 n=1 Tax=Geotrypetes seraphini TaxID=260995 RepID=A0A6P8SBN5_GEOSA|nr:uncharacterized protein LOC117366660 [Geotrypetes seraphini]